MLSNELDYEALARGYNQQAALNNREYKKEMEELEKREAECLAMISRATRAILEGSPLATELERQSAVVTKNLESIRNKMEKLKANASVYVSAEILERKINNYRELVRGDQQAQRRLIEAMLGKIVVNEGGLIEVYLKGENESSRTDELHLW